MKLGGGVVAGVPRATIFPTIVFRRNRISVSCSSLSSTPEHVTFIKDVAATHPPQHLTQLLRMLKARGESVISPGAKQGLIPLAIPLTKNDSGTITALLRWPTAPPGMEMPVIEVNKHGVWLLAKSVDQFIHRILVEEDANSTPERSDCISVTSNWDPLCVLFTVFISLNCVYITQITLNLNKYIQIHS